MRKFLILPLLLFFLPAKLFAGDPASIENLLGERPGAIIVSDIKTSKILYRVVHPGVEGKSYPPGSAIKVATAFAALREGITDTRRKIECKGRIKFSGKEFKCWKETGHGKLNLTEAIARSCNIHFLTLGKELGASKLKRHFKFFGIGGSLSADKLSPEESILLAIGEGEKLKVTPRDMLSVVRKIAQGRGKDFEIVRAGMRQAALTGTAQGLRSLKLPVAGKTGTASRPSSIIPRPSSINTHAWFIGYAPADRPKIGMVIFLEKGEGFSDAVPLAKRVCEFLAPALK